MRSFQFAVAVAAALLVVCTARATPQDDPRSIAGDAGALHVGGSAPVVDDIAFHGLRRVSPAAVRAQIVTRLGESLDQARLTGDVRTLGKLGWFASVRVETEPAAQPLGALADDNQHVQLDFYLEERPFLTGVDFSGSRLLSQRQIEKLLADRKLAAK